MSPSGSTAIEAYINGCKKGDRKAQQFIYKALYGKMMSTCLRYMHDEDEAKDVAQEGFIKMFDSIKKYTGDGSFEGWVRRIMVNTAIDHLRRKHKQMLSLERDNVQLAETDHDADEQKWPVRAEDVIRALQEISPGYRAVFNLYVIEGYTHQEIAEILNISVGSSKSNLSKARVKIKSVLLKKYSNDR